MIEYNIYVQFAQRQTFLFCHFVFTYCLVHIFHVINIIKCNVGDFLQTSHWCHANRHLPPLGCRGARGASAMFPTWSTRTALPRTFSTSSVQRTHSRASWDTSSRCVTCWGWDQRTTRSFTASWSLVSCHGRPSHCGRGSTAAPHGANTRRAPLAQTRG